MPNGERQTKSLGCPNLAGLYIKRGQCRYWIGDYVGARRDFETACGQGGENAGIDRARAVLELANLAYLQGDVPRCLATLQRARRALGGMASRDMRFQFFRYQGNAYRVKGDSRSALRCYRRAQRYVSQDNDRSSVMNLIGLAYHGAGKYAEAIRSIRGALILARKAGDVAAQGSFLANMGFVYTYWGKPDKAVACFHRAMESQRIGGMKATLANTVLNWGNALCRMEQYDAALEKWREALRMNEEMGDYGGVAMIHNNIGYLLMERGKLDQSLEHLHASLRLKKKYRLTGYLPSTHTNLGKCYYQYYLRTKKRGYYREAKTHARQGFRIAARFHNRRDMDNAREIGEKLGIPLGK